MQLFRRPKPCQDNLPRTNNSLEGWHQAFKRRLNVTHPTVSKLLKVIRNEQAANEILIEQTLMELFALSTVLHFSCEFEQVSS